MGAGQSRDGRLDDSESEEEEEEEEEEEDVAAQQHKAKPSPSSSSAGSKDATAALDFKLGSLSLDGKRSAAQGPQKAKLYRHLGGSTGTGQWVTADKVVAWEFVREGDEDNDDSDDDDGGDSRSRSWKSWFLLVGNKVRARVDEKLQMKFFDDQLRVDFVHFGVWALKFSSLREYRDFDMEYRNCLFENTFMLEATEENKMKVFGKDFMGWAKPEEADDSIWEDAEDTFEVPPSSRPLAEAFVEPAKGGIQSLTMGALDHSYLVSSKGIEAVRNMPSGIHGKGVAVTLANESDPYSTPKKAMLIKGESSLMVLSPSKKDVHATGVHQVDVGTGKIVTEWKFEKDGTPITMRDVTNESKGAQLDSAGATFLGLDDNRLCRWDMRDRHGIVQQLASPVLDWAEGHQFSRGTNFQCFATTGDGSIVVGSKDGKVRLYGTTSMRMAKTAFPGLGSPITHVDVTYDGKWILATTDAYMILISTMFKDKDGKMKTGFSGRMGNKIAAPRLLKLSPLDAHLSGKNYKFHRGQFSWVTESGKQERNLVATVGNFTVVWNFRRVKESNHECYRATHGLKSCYCYRIIPKEESIVESRFMHENYTSNSPTAPLVVATPQNVSSFNVARD